MSERTYSVYLVERGSEQGGQRAVTSPIEGNELEFYDTGVWLNRDRGRNFFPYQQVRTIREHAGERSGDDERASPDDERASSDGEQASPDEERESAADERPDDVAEDVPEDRPDDAPEGTDGSQGAEEDLLE